MAQRLVQGYRQDSRRLSVRATYGGKVECRRKGSPIAPLELQIDPTQLAGRELQNVIDAIPHRVRGSRRPRSGIGMQLAQPLADPLYLPRGEDLGHFRPAHQVRGADT